MARTKASVGAKLCSGKSTKARNVCSAPPGNFAGGVGFAVKAVPGSSGNAYFPRETPGWQKPITRFFIGGCPEPQSDGETPGSSAVEAPIKRKKKVNVINSDTESENEESSENRVQVPQEEADTPIETGNVDVDPKESLDTSLISSADLPPLSPEENSHKIAEYFQLTKKTDNGLIKVKLSMTKNKGKGKGKNNKNNDSDISDEIAKDDSESVTNGKENLQPNVETRQEENRCEKQSSTIKRGLEESVEYSNMKKLRLDKYSQ